MEDVAAVPDDYRSLARLLPPMMVFPIWIEHALKVAGCQVATKIKASIAACHFSASCSTFGILVMKLRAS